MRKLRSNPQFLQVPRTDQKGNKNKGRKKEGAREEKGGENIHLKK